ncbi:Transposon Ty3-G Gag-Pol polyprotein [Smittium culicis]|uniref:Transposon Ty3-G Gag-Pol polyprotein n=1 Tax=Smittium culicis TaxID=133412 RepID=A0A1R1XFV0_9FUNG|nr:Transposon Ty3-G Gag-Pol polyprotein [Smittium culicis]
MLIESPVLQQPDPDKTFILSTDASSIAIGAVLEQADAEENLKPIAYYSRKLQQAERNYMNYEREGLALVAAIKNFRTYLLGRPFIVYTDNSAIASLFKQKEPVGRLVRWIHILSEYDCEIRHRAGKDNPVADYLSRPSFVGYIQENVKQPIGFEEIFNYISTGKTEVHTKNDAAFRRTISKYVIIDQILCRKTKKEPLRVLYSLQKLYNALNILNDQLGHFAVNTVWDWVRARYWRPYLHREVQHYISPCVQCQKYTMVKPSYKFNGQSQISGVFNRWATDFLGPFPLSSKGNVYICCYIESLSRFPYVEATADETAISAINLGQNMISLFGSPKTITADRGSCYKSRVFKDF